MPEWASAPGTKRRRVTLVGLNLIASCLLGLAFSTACVSNSQNQSFWSSDQDDDYESQDDDNAEDDASNDMATNLAATLPHPKGITAFSTRVFVTTQAQVPQEQTAACFEQISAIAAESVNQEDLLSGLAQASSLVANDFSVYHFCFYQMVVKLDERMLVGGPLMDDLATAFFSGMRQLWILARALDAQTGQGRYLKWLTQRYIAMSQEYFGRNLEPVMPPLDKTADKLFTPQKPASSFPIE